MCLFGISFSYTWVQAWTLNTLFDSIIKEAENSKPIDQIFDGKISTDNLYTKALKIVKWQTVTTLQNSIQLVADNLSQKNNTSVNAQDVMNILYDTSTAVNGLSSAMNLITRWTNPVIPAAMINASYGKLRNTIPACKDLINQAERTCIKQRVGNQYYTIENNYTDLWSFKEQNFGEDLFTNGTLDDSAYDILVDIKNIGNIMFTSFISPTQTLFYTLPKSKSAATNSTLASIANGLGGNGGAEVLGTFGTTTNWSTTNGTNNGNTTNWSTTNGTTSNTNTTPTTTTPLKDAAVDAFVNATNTTPTSTTTSNAVNLLGVAKGNICLPSVSAWEDKKTTITPQPNVTTIQKYLDELDAATKETTPTNDYTPPAVPIITDIENASASEIASMNQLIEGKINNLFDPESTKSCTAKCTVGTFSEQTMCKIECLCFTVEYPKQWAAWLEWLDGQLKVRFCTIPVQQNRVSKGKDIYGRDDSLTRMKDVFENLLNGGEMMKYERPKEYLDSPLGAIQRAKFISFEIKIYIKSLFSNIQNKAKVEETKNNTAKTEERTKWISSDPSTDTNRNIIANNIAAERAKKNIADSYEKTQENIATEKAKIEAMAPKNNATQALENSKNKKAIIFNEQMGNFLEQNSNFRLYVTDQINSFNVLSKDLKNTLSSMN